MALVIGSDRRRAETSTRHSDTPRKRRVALALWVIWAVVVWNAVFDYTIVEAGNRYVVAATAGAYRRAYVGMDDWMAPAVRSGLRRATAASAAIVLVGVAGFRAAAARRTRSTSA
jgi:hypothetical protein